MGKLRVQTVRRTGLEPVPRSADTVVKLMRSFVADYENEFSEVQQHAGNPCLMLDKESLFQSFSKLVTGYEMFLRLRQCQINHMTSLSVAIKQADWENARIYAWAMFNSLTKEYRSVCHQLKHQIPAHLRDQFKPSQIKFCE